MIVNNITTIYQAFDLGWFAIESDFNMRESLGIPKEAFVIGTVANYRPVKGLDILMAAILKLAKHENIHWVIIGEGCSENFLFIAVRVSSKGPALISC